MRSSLLLAFALTLPALAASKPKIHTVSLGAVRKVPYTPAFSTPDSKDDDSTTLKVRPLFVDDKQKEWTVGELHNLSDRTFAVRRVLHINDTLPTETGEHWVWQPASWILVDRSTGHITALHLPDFDSAVSSAVWFRDYAAFCGISSSAKGGSALVAVVAQASGRKAVAQRVIGKWPQPDRTAPPCETAKWQRLPMRATLQPVGGDPVTFDVVGSTSLIEEGDNDDDN